MLSIKSLPNTWKEKLNNEFKKEYFRDLSSFLENEMKHFQVFPCKDEIFNAFHLTPYKKVKVVILGQDPYHDDNQAHGLAFSVKHGIKKPPSLRNIFKELSNDIGCTIPNHGCLDYWAKQGVLLLNTVLTVRAHKANSHSGKGWEIFTDSVIKHLDENKKNLIFVLWGKNAEKKTTLINPSKHSLLISAHPSPLSASRGFLGSSPFSKINLILKKNGQDPIDWQILDHMDDYKDLPLFTQIENTTHVCRNI